ncbi:hypothetical protein [Rheinheimera baltica]|uniref:hypothetical protein n=1 Tax=Rheinheimera baltica TaxID=67576 RepID=UPI00273E6398|nr:hypothetical protein [Rheinheimera baltica]MDP5149465.1 hypothetical protein [Rheinheimera baltica]
MAKSKAEITFMKRFMTAMVVFLLLIAIQAFSLELLNMPTWLNVAATVLPVAPLVWAFFIFQTRYRTLDEYMKALTGEAFLWMIGLLCFSSFIYGMLAMKFPMPEVNLAFVMPAVFSGHGLIVQLLVWRDNEESN